MRGPDCTCNTIYTRVYLHAYDTQRCISFRSYLTRFDDDDKSVAWHLKSKFCSISQRFYIHIYCFVCDALVGVLYVSFIGSWISLRLRCWVFALDRLLDAGHGWISVSRLDESWRFAITRGKGREKKKKKKYKWKRYAIRIEGNTMDNFSVAFRIVGSETTQYLLL